MQNVLRILRFVEADFGWLTQRGPSQRLYRADRRIIFRVNNSDAPVVGGLLRSKNASVQPFATC